MNIHSSQSAVKLLALSACLMLSGCAASDRVVTETVAPATPHQATVQGMVHGGQQPVTGASVYLFAAGTLGYANPATSLLNTADTGVATDAAGNGYVTTTPNGGFNITGLYSCPSSSTQVYIAATGGNPGLSAGTNNSALSLIAALGACGNLNSNTFITINEVTTVASVWALAPFMGGASALGSTPSNTAGLSTAFASVSQLANTANGSASGPSLPAGATLPVGEINTLANILAACVNTTGGVAGDGSPCGNLFAAATPSNGIAPADTVGAAINIAQNPGASVAALFNIVAASGPFQPTLTSAPTDWTIAVQYTGLGLSNPSSVAIDGAGNVWITNCGSANCATPGAGSVTQLNGNGVLVGSTSAGGINGPLAVAIDLSGNAWIANYYGNSISELNSSLSPVAGPFTGGGINGPNSLAISNNGNVWINNLANGTASELNSSGGAVSGTSGYTISGASGLDAIVLSPH